MTGNELPRVRGLYSGRDRLVNFCRGPHITGDRYSAGRGVR